MERVTIFILPRCRHLTPAPWLECYGVQRATISIHRPCMGRTRCTINLDMYRHNSIDKNQVCDIPNPHQSPTDLPWLTCTATRTWEKMKDLQRPDWDCLRITCLSREADGWESPVTKDFARVDQTRYKMNSMCSKTVQTMMQFAVTFLKFNHMPFLNSLPKFHPIVCAKCAMRLHKVLCDDSF